MDVSETDVCGVCRCRLSWHKYRLHSSGLYEQLKRVCGRDMPASLPSQFVCRTCMRQIQRADAQRVRYEESRRGLLLTYARVHWWFQPCCLVRRARWRVRQVLMANCTYSNKTPSSSEETNDVSLCRNWRFSIGQEAHGSPFRRH